MHDCPNCRVPLHGHEETCPSCGVKQYVKPEYRQMNVPPAPSVNPMPFIAAFVVLLIIGVIAAANSWIGQAILHPAPPVDPIAQMKPLDARTQIETLLAQGLSAVGAPAKFVYKVDEKDVTKDVNSPVEMTVETTLQNPDQHKAIVEPVKQYMDRAQVPTLKMEDAKSKATWTYSVTLSQPSADNAPLFPSDGTQQNQTPTAAPAPSAEGGS